MTKAGKSLWRLFCVALIVLALAAPCFAADTATSQKINYDEDTTIHWLPNPNDSSERIILYCMNNKLHWPHSTSNLPDVPEYVEGYLTEKDFASAEEYRECIQQLEAILYAGYPYNGLHLYEIVSEGHQITEAEFNELLKAPDVIRSDFPDSIGNTQFTYADYEEHMDRIQKFMEEVLALAKGGRTASGLTHGQITALPFYKAMNCISMSVGSASPLQWYDNIYSKGYFVTEEQAYTATKDAVWNLLYKYKIADNDLSDITSGELAETLVKEASSARLLQEKPSSDKVSVTGDAVFSYNPQDGKWHTGTLTVNEPATYRGTYTLDLPDGVTVENSSSGNTVTADTSFSLVSDKEITGTKEISLKSDGLVWIDELYQYSPAQDVIASDGKRFQHMVGADIRRASVSTDFTVKTEEGSLSVSKKVEGEDNPNGEFRFTVELLNQKISGEYGDLTFKIDDNSGNSTASFALKSGESKTALHLPAGTKYKVTEAENEKYTSSAKNAEGTITAGQKSEVEFTNTRKYHDLTVSKVLSEPGDQKDREFTFVITLKNSDGSPVTGTFNYEGETVSGEDEGVTAPKNGSLEFRDGSAEITLSHGQAIRLKDLPTGSLYTVEEKESEGYTPSYNGSKEAASGTLSKDAEVGVVNSAENDPDKEEGKDDPGKAEGKDDPGKNESGSENGGKTAKKTSQKSESSNPDTGDASGLALWIVVLAGAGAGAAVLIRRKLSCPTDM